MSWNHARRYTTAIALALALTLTSCGDDEPKPIPETPTKPSPSVSPAPSAEPLSADLESDYKAAVQKDAEYQAFVDRVAADPKVTDERTVELAKLATKPAINDFSDEIEDLIRNDVHSEGHREVAWTSPVSVKAGKEVVFLQCTTPGTFALVGDGQRFPDKANVVTKVTVIKFKDNWFVKDSEGAGAC